LVNSVGHRDTKDTVDSTTYTYTSVDLTEPSYDVSETCEAVQVSPESLIRAALKTEDDIGR